jgi:hypothetical protein
MNENAEHRLAVVAAVKTAQLIAQYPDASDEELIAKIKALGVSEVEAYKLCFFIPSAFTWALLKKMGLTSFPSTYIVEEVNGEETELPIAGEHYFTAALSIAVETVENGWSEEMPRTCFEKVIGRSPEMGALNKFLAAGHALSDAKLLPLRLYGMSQWKLTCN